MKRIILFFSIWSFTLLTIVFAGCLKPVEEKNISVRTEAAEQCELTKSVTLSGVLLPSQTADISSRITGQVKSVGPDVGDTVKKGDVLIVLDTDMLNAQLLQAESGLKSAEAAAQVVQSQIDLAKIDLDAAQKSYNRNKKLYEAGSTSQSEMDDQTNKLDTSLRRYKNVSGPALSQAFAAIDTAKANIKNLQVQIDKATIRSPINGIVTNRNADPGEVVSPGPSMLSGATLLSIADTAILKMKSSVSQDLLPLLKKGQEIDVTVDIYPEKPLRGILSRIGPVAFNTGRIFPIEIAIKNDGSILSGLSAHATLNMTEEKCVVIPSSAVIEGSEESHVFIIHNGVAKKRFIRTGLRNDQNLEILEGIKPGELVATSNIRSLNDNMPVDIQ